MNSLISIISPHKQTMLSQYNILNKYYTFDASSLVGSSVPNLATGTPVYDASILAYGSRTPSIITSSKVVGTGSVNLNYLNGTNGGYVKINSLNFLNTGLTIVCWLYLPTVGDGAWSRLIDFGSGQASNNILYSVFNGISIYNASVYQPGATSGIYTSATDLNVWIQFAWTMSYATTATSRTRIYKNKLGTTFNATPFFSDNNAQYPDISVTRNSNYIGRSNWSVDPMSNFYIDDFRIYNKELSATEIQTLFNNRDSSYNIIT